MIELPPLAVVHPEDGFSRRTTTVRKRNAAEEIVANLQQVDVPCGQGRALTDAIRAIGVTEVTYDRWRNEYGGLEGDQVLRLKELEAENVSLIHEGFCLSERARGSCLSLVASIPLSNCRHDAVDRCCDQGATDVDLTSDESDLSP